MRTRATTFAALSLVFLFAAPLPRGHAVPESCYGHELPGFRSVFICLFRITADEMSMEQLRTTSSDLTDEERASISYYLGYEGHNQVKKGLPKQKQEFLDEKYQLHSQVTPDYDFKKLFPHILAVSNNNLTKEQYINTLERLTPEQIASQSFYMGPEGRKTFFTEMTEDRVEILLNHTPQWVILETGMRTYEDIRSYSSILYKQERLGDKLQGKEKILLKYREKPRSIYMKWLDGPWKGRELVYNEALLGKGKVRVRESGALGIIPVTLSVDSAIAQRGSNHKVTEIGLKNLLDMIDENYRAATPNNDLERKNHGIEQLDGHNVYVMESVLPDDRSKGYYCHRIFHYIDYIRSLEIKARIYTFGNELYETYYYTRIKINPGLTDNDFDPDNPDYDL
ncbi:MAG: DUF1571 domain-containing protein [bacterium]